MGACHLRRLCGECCWIKLTHTVTQHQNAKGRGYDRASWNMLLTRYCLDLQEEIYMIMKGLHFTWPPLKPLLKLPGMIDARGGSGAHLLWPFKFGLSNRVAPSSVMLQMSAVCFVAIQTTNRRKNRNTYSEHKFANMTISSQRNQTFPWDLVIFLFLKKFAVSASGERSFVLHRNKFKQPHMAGSCLRMGVGYGRPC